MQHTLEAGRISEILDLNYQFTDKLRRQGAYHEWFPESTKKANSSLTGHISFYTDTDQILILHHHIRTGSAINIGLAGNLYHEAKDLLSQTASFLKRGQEISQGSPQISHVIAASHPVFAEALLKIIPVFKPIGYVQWGEYAKSLRSLAGSMSAFPIYAAQTDDFISYLQYS